MVPRGCDTVGIAATLAWVKDELRRTGERDAAPPAVTHTEPPSERWSGGTGPCGLRVAQECAATHDHGPAPTVARTDGQPLADDTAPGDFHGGDTVSVPQNPTQNAAPAGDTAAPDGHRGHTIGARAVACGVGVRSGLAGSVGA